MPRIGGVNFWAPVLIQQRLQANLKARTLSTTENKIAGGIPHIQNNVGNFVPPSPPVRGAPITPGFDRPDWDAD